LYLLRDSFAFDNADLIASWTDRERKELFRLHGESLFVVADDFRSLRMPASEKWPEWDSGIWLRDKLSNFRALERPRDQELRALSARREPSQHTYAIYADRSVPFSVVYQQAENLTQSAPTELAISADNTVLSLAVDLSRCAPAFAEWPDAPCFSTIVEVTNASVRIGSLRATYREPLGPAPENDVCFGVQQSPEHRGAFVSLAPNDVNGLVGALARVAEPKCGTVGVKIAGDVNWDTAVSVLQIANAYSSRKPLRVNPPPK